MPRACATPRTASRSSGRARSRRSHRHTNGSISANTACAGSTATNACTSSRRRHCGRSSRRCGLRRRGAIACRNLGRRSSVAARELDAVAFELEAHRLVTLTGVGGSGKTRLAIEAARAAQAAFPDGAEFVDLSTVTDEEGTYPAVATAFGLQTPPGIAEAVDRRIYGYLANRRTLVVIDNCEHLLDAVAELVDAIMQNCEDVRVLATSREPLRVEDERVVQVGSLDVAEDAVKLFRDRAAGHAGDDTTIRRICERLDGIPLAIELAAARTSHLSLEDIAERLDDRFRLLTGGRRRVQRQQTLQATLDWSHDLLTPDERKLLRSLAVFNGPIRLDALEGICGRDHADVIGVLGSLVERSMVSHDPGERRYRLLETVRLYAEQKLLEAGEADEYRRRHRDWFLAHVCSLPLEECFFPGDTSRRIATDIDELRAARRWSYDGGDIVAAAEITTRMAWAAVHAESQEVAAWATTLVPRLDLESELAFHCFLAGAWSGAATRSRETSESADVPVDIYLRRLSAVFDQLIRLAEARTDDVSVFARAFVANSLYGFGLVLGDDAQCDAARKVSDRAVAMADARRPSAWCGYARFQAALSAIADGRLERAAALLRRCVTDSDDLVQGMYDPLLALVLHALGEPDAYEVATRSQARTDSDPNVVTAAMVIALELAARSDQLGARKELRATIPEVARSVVMMRTAWLISAAGVAIHDGDHERAARWLACASSAGGVFTAPQGWVLFQRYMEQLRDVLPESDRARLREEGRSVPLATALDEVAAWCDEAPQSSLGRTAPTGHG